jgi:hypothetical protein
MTDDRTRQQDLAAARQVLDGMALPPEILRYAIEAGEDHSGDPALWVTLTVAPTGRDRLADERRIGGLLPVMDEVRNRILGAGVRSWPYFRLAEAAS